MWIRLKEVHRPRQRYGYLTESIRSGKKIKQKIICYLGRVGTTKCPIKRRHITYLKRLDIDDRALRNKVIRLLLQHVRDRLYEPAELREIVNKINSRKIKIKISKGKVMLLEERHGKFFVF